MQIDRAKLIANIQNYFEQNKAINLPFVGSLVLVKVPATRSKSQNITSPPQKVIKYQESVSDDVDEFINFLNIETEYDISACKSNFGRYCKSLVADLDILGRAQISGLGTFYKLGDKISFSASASLISKSSYGLPVLNIKPLTFVSDKKDNTIVETKRLYTENTVRRGFWNAVSVAAIFLLLIFAYQNLKTLDFSTAELGAINTVEFDQSRLNKKPEKILVDDPTSELIPGKVSKESSSAACALILGSFSRKANAVALQKRILSSDYELYTEEFHEFYRIGISLNCEEVKSSTFHAIEADFGIDPWLRIAVN